MGAPANENAATRLTPAQLRWRCDPALLDGDGVELPPVQGIVGQDRALTALETGLGIRSRGYNIFVTGLTGSGRTTTVKQLLSQLAPTCPVPRDRAYVMNFRAPDKPRLLTLIAGRARKFAAAMARFAEHLKREIPLLGEDKSVIARRDALVAEFDSAAEGRIKAFQAGLKHDPAGEFGVVQIQTPRGGRPEVVPMFDGEPVPPQQLGELVAAGKLDEDKAEALVKRLGELQRQLEAALRENQLLLGKLEDEMRAAVKEAAAERVREPLAEIRRQFKDPAISAWLDEVERDVRDHLADIAVSVRTDAHGPGMPEHDEEEEDDDDDDAGDSSEPQGYVRRYAVNVLIDHTETQGCPTVIEHNPTGRSIFGTIEHIPAGPGAFTVDHMTIRGGSLLESDGGFLILDVQDAMEDADVWGALKRTLKSGQLEIRGVESPLFPSGVMLKPEAIPLDVKVILIGEPVHYEALAAYDAEFRRIFKVKAEFSPEMPVDAQNLRHFAGMMSRLCAEERLLPLEPAAAARLVEAGVREAGGRSRITTRFTLMNDVVREANYWATRTAASAIGASHVAQAIAERHRRNSLFESHLQRLLLDDVIIVHTDGKRVGQVNGLSVYQLGDASFGKPTLITATASVGSSGIINIEREANLSGGIYDKGVLIITGYLRRMFAHNKPLALTASLCFEQSYSGVDGDSASIAEIFALVSELSGIPLDQSFAVTGSISQRGQIQPIGGVNEKIEGFYDLCHARGLTGQQGVIIPQRNVADLMLRNDVVEAVAGGKFHIHAISSVEQGVELLTGVPAGVPGKDGVYPEGSVFRAVDDRLVAFDEIQWGGEERPILDRMPPAADAGRGRPPRG